MDRDTPPIPPDDRTARLARRVSFGFRRPGVPGDGAGLSDRMLILRTRAFMVAQRWPTLCDTHAPTWVDLTGLPIHSH